MTSEQSFDHKKFLATLTDSPGVYKMINATGRVLYVGKARHLKKRVASYFKPPNQLDAKTRAMIGQVGHIEVNITRTENEALLLESTLIKTLRPRYNILLRDDKSYPYIFLSGHPHYPRLQRIRGAQSLKGEYFGPYPNVRSVDETIDLLQRLFKIRSCQDTVFNHRTRPCLQYQIKRCTAPCVDYITPEAYQESVKYVRLFLEGKNEAVIEGLNIRMEESAQQLNFETAAICRDQIAQLRQIQAVQVVKTHLSNVDIVALVQRDQVMCVEVLSIRNRQWLDGKAYFPKMPPELTSEEEGLNAFLSQYYLSAQRTSLFPTRIYIEHTLKDRVLLESVLSDEWKSAIKILNPRTEQEKNWLHMAKLNAQQALESHLSSQILYDQALKSLQTELKLQQLPERLECFDISHTQGEATMASCVVFDRQGPAKESYRRFKIQGITGGDDYAAMHQALSRRYAALVKENKPLPDVLIVDGGKGQLSQAEAIFGDALITLIGIAKGPTRKAGLETIWISGQEDPLVLTSDSPALHLLQRIRDEAHRFAITGHRKQRAKSRTRSRLEDIEGIGPNRRRELLYFFGGLQGVMEASVVELCKVPGIKMELAQRIYDRLHGL